LEGPLGDQGLPPFLSSISFGAIYLFLHPQCWGD
jgi:hypothetical protein